MQLLDWYRKELLLQFSSNTTDLHLSFYPVLTLKHVKYHIFGVDQSHVDIY